MTTDREPLSLRILAVDDTASLLKAFKAMTLMYHPECTVLDHENPLQALSFFQDHREEIDVLFTDYSMPQMKGTELARHVRQLSGIPIILATADPFEEVQAADPTHAINIFLQKPYRGQHITDSLVKAREILRTR